MEKINKGKLAVGYCRVSTDEQAKNGLSIEVQEKLCRKSIEEDGFEVLKIIKDEGKSAGTLNRTGIKEVMQLTIEKKINAVYSIHSDRIARNTLDYLNLKELFRNNDVLLKCIHQPMSDDSAASRTMDTVLASFNEMQRLVTSEKVKATMSAKVKLGIFPAIPPLGYKNMENPDENVSRLEKKIIGIEEKTAPLIIEMFKLYSTGNFSGYDLQDMMYERGLRGRKGKKMSGSRIYDLLKNRFYLGEVKWGKYENKNGKHKPLIDESLYNQVQSVLGSHNKHVCRRRKYTWLLNGFLYCYEHHCRYTAEWHKIKSKVGKIRRIAYYHCTNRNGCGKYAEQVELEKKVAEKFQDLEFNPEFVDKVIEKVKKIFYERRRKYDGKRQGLVNQRTAIEGKKRVMEDKLFENVISNEDFIVRKKEFSEELANIDEQLEDIGHNQEVKIDIAREILSFTRNVYKTYQKAPLILKRHYLGFFWEKFEVNDGIIIKSHPTLLFRELLKLEQINIKSGKTDNPNISNVSNRIIINNEWLREQDSNLRPSD